MKNPLFSERVTGKRVGPFSRSVQKSWWPCTSNQRAEVSTLGTVPNDHHRVGLMLSVVDHEWTTIETLCANPGRTFSITTEPFMCWLTPYCPCHTVPSRLTTIPWWSTSHPLPDTLHHLLLCLSCRRLPPPCQTDTVLITSTGTSLPLCPLLPDRRNTCYQPIGCAVPVQLKHVYPPETIGVQPIRVTWTTGPTGNVYI